MRLSTILTLSVAVLTITLSVVLAFLDYQGGRHLVTKEVERFFSQSQHLAELIIDNENSTIPATIGRMRLGDQPLLQWHASGEMQYREKLVAQMERQMGDNLDLVVLMSTAQQPLLAGFMLDDVQPILNYLQRHDLGFGTRLLIMEDAKKPGYFLAASKKVVDPVTGEVLGRLVGLVDLGRHFGILHQIITHSELLGVALVHGGHVVAADIPDEFREVFREILKEQAISGVSYRSDALFYRHELYFEGERSGLELIMLSRNMIGEALWERLLLQLSVAILLLIVIGILLFLFYRYTITRSLERLTAYIQQLLSTHEDMAVPEIMIDEYRGIAHHLRNLIGALKESEHLHKTLFDTTGAAIFVFDKQGQILKANAEMAIMTGVATESLEAGVRWSDLIPERDRFRIEAIMNQHLSGSKGAPHSFEFHLLGKNDEIPCKMAITMFADRDRGVGAFVNLSEQKELERQLREMNEKLEEKIRDRTLELERYKEQLEVAQKIAQQGSFRWNPVASTLECSHEMIYLLGVSVEEKRVGNSIQLSQLPRETEKAWKEFFTLDRYENQDGDLELIDSSGKMRVLHIITRQERLGREEERSGTITGVAQDVTHVRQLEREKMKNEQLLIQQSRLAAMGEMIGAIAHQWRQPLASLGGILINIQDAYEFGELDDKELTQYVKNAERLLRYMSDTIDDFRSFFKPSKQKERFNVLHAVFDAFRIVSAQLRSHRIVFEFFVDAADTKLELFDDHQLPNDIPELMALGYPNEFKQVILNLLNNAKDAILGEVEQGRLQTAKGVIRINVLSSDDQIEIFVSDNGGGVPEEIIHKIFEPYFSSKEEGKGSGIGLYMAKMIIENNMDGQIGVRNEKDGAVFFVTIHGSR